MTHTRHATACERLLTSVYIYNGEILTRDAYRDIDRRGVKAVVASWTVAIHGSGRAVEGRCEKERIARSRKKFWLYAREVVIAKSYLGQFCALNSMNWLGFV